MLTSYVHRALRALKANASEVRSECRDLKLARRIAQGRLDLNERVAILIRRNREPGLNSLVRRSEWLLSRKLNATGPVVAPRSKRTASRANPEIVAVMAKEARKESRSENLLFFAGLVGGFKICADLCQREPGRFEFAARV